MRQFLLRLGILLLLLSMQSCSLFSAAGISSQGQPIKKVPKEGLVSTSKNINPLVNHAEWDRLLNQYVDNNGMVNYKGFLNEKKVLENYLNYLRTLPPDKSWSVQELLAYYINLYNAKTIDLILENYPIKSIKEINGAWTKGIIQIGKRNLSLGGIENGILRKMNEPRIHFAINCASISCPTLLNEAFVPTRINEQLETVTRNFINGDKNEISKSKPELSSIFDWYKKDYKVKGETDVISFINEYSDTKINRNAVIIYKEYNWNLNEKK